MSDFSCAVVDETNILGTVQKMNSDGFAVMENIFSEDTISSLFSLCMKNYVDSLNVIASRSLHFGIGVKNGFKEIVQRHKLRFEIPHGMDCDLVNCCASNSILQRLKFEILGEGAVVVNKSFVISLPGTEVINKYLSYVHFYSSDNLGFFLYVKNQGWHTDGPHLSMAENLPCHCFNIFIPLIDISLEHGPTQFRPGSHLLTRNFQKSMLIGFAKKTLRPLEAPCLSKGSMLLV